LGPQPAPTSCWHRAARAFFWGRGIAKRTSRCDTAHRADLQLRRDGSQGEALEDGEPQGCGLGCGQLLHQSLQGRPGEGDLQRGLSGGRLQRRLGCGSGQLIEQGVLTSDGSIEAGVAERAAALLVLPAGDAHQADAIAQVLLQGTADAAAQIGPSGLACFAAGSGAGTRA
jgi:hypothetical protein